jgi:hypothetical protein
MTEQELALFEAMLDFGYAMIVEEFPGLPKHEWLKEVLATFESDRGFWEAAHPDGTMDDFLR